MGAPLGTRLIRREGRAGSAMPLHVAKVRSGNRGPEGAADERARKPGSTAGDTSQNQATRSRNGSWRNGLCCGTVDAGGGNEPDPQETQSGESHAMSRREQPERGSTHHSTREVALCVGGTGATTRVKGSTIKEDSREGVEERVHSGSTRKKVRESARDVGHDGLVKQSDCDGKQQPHLTSCAHGARKNG